MTIKDYRTHFIQELATVYDEAEAESFFYLILEAKQQLHRIDLALRPDLTLSESEIGIWDTLLNDLKKEIPIQYLLGKTSFYGSDFQVNEHVLIPRPETEELVAWLLEETEKKNILKQKTSIKILDIGTGSGCIAISVKKHLPQAKITAIDVCEKAIEVATNNAKINQVAITFVQKNILETNDLQEQYDVIISNPPYVRHLEKSEIKKNVLDYEPHVALFVADTDALVFYKKIAQLALKNLTPNGKLFFEINQYLGKEMIELLQKSGFQNIELRKDMYENDRMIMGSLKKEESRN